MSRGTQAERRWLPRLDSLPAEFFPPGWLGFGLRTWVSVCLALCTAFWLQIDAPAGSAVTVMILAQPLRGQALSKAAYRLLGTITGGAVSLFLISAFSQDRALFLGGTALWLAACAFVGTLERDFRAYGALLAGYTVAIVAVNTIDVPQSTFSVLISRMAAIVIGIASVMVVNVATGSPKAWQKLALSLERLSVRVRSTSHDALMGKPVPDTMETTALASEILSLATQISYARTEIDRSRRRSAGARLAINGMLTVLTCGRAIAIILRNYAVSEIAVTHVRRWHEGTDDGTSREETLSALLRSIRADQPGYVPGMTDCYFLERSATLLSNRKHIRTGMDTLLLGTPAGAALTLAQLGRYPDHVTAFVNACRVLLGFSLSAGICVLSGMPSSSIALAQTALTLALASTVIDTARFGIGAIIGLPLAVAVAAWMNFWILPLFSDIGALYLVFLPQTLFACLLLINPHTNAVGFNYGAFFPAILAIGNHHSFDPNEFISRNIFYVVSSILTFVMLALLLPPNPRHRLLRISVSIARDLERQLNNRQRLSGPQLLSQKYDRLAQAMLWAKQASQDKVAARKMLARMETLEDFANTYSRCHDYLDRACDFPTLKNAATQARNRLQKSRLNVLHEEIPALGQALAAGFDDRTQSEQVCIVLCVGGLQAVSRAQEQNRSAMRHYGIARKRW